MLMISIKGARDNAPSKKVIALPDEAAKQESSVATDAADPTALDTVDSSVVVE